MRFASRHTNRARAKGLTTRIEEHAGASFLRPPRPPFPDALPNQTRQPIMDCRPEQPRIWLLTSKIGGYQTATLGAIEHQT